MLCWEGESVRLGAHTALLLGSMERPGQGPGQGQDATQEEREPGMASQTYTKSGPSAPSPLPDASPGSSQAAEAEGMPFGRQAKRAALPVGWALREGPGSTVQAGR